MQLRYHALLSIECLQKQFGLIIGDGRGGVKGAIKLVIYISHSSFNVTLDTVVSENCSKKRAEM